MMVNDTIHEFMNSWLIKEHENQVMLSWIHEFMTYQGTWKSGDAFMNSWLIKVHENQAMLSWIHDLSRYMKIRWRNKEVTFVLQLSRYIKIRWCFNEFMNSWLIKVHENQVVRYESNICTAIIKVHKNQVSHY